MQRICENGRQLIAQGHENAADFELKINELLHAWHELKEAVDDRQRRLAESEKAHQVWPFICIQYRSCLTVQ